MDEYVIELRRGTARATGQHSVQVDGQEISAGAILIAAGARPAVPEIDGLTAAGCLTSTTALEVTDAPARLAVISANAVGLELGQMFGNFGTQSRSSHAARSPRARSPRSRRRSGTCSNARATRSSSTPAPTTQPQFVYAAAGGGATAAQNALGGDNDRLDFSNLPQIIFSSPQTALAGLTEAQAQAQGSEGQTSVLPLQATLAPWSTATPPACSSSSPQPTPAGCWAPASSPTAPERSSSPPCWRSRPGWASRSSPRPGRRISPWPKGSSSRPRPSAVTSPGSRERHLTVVPPLSSDSPVRSPGRLAPTRSGTFHASACRGCPTPSTGLAGGWFSLPATAPEGPSAQD